MRLGFFGTPDVAATYLEALAREHEVVGVVTQPDRPAGRSGTPQPSPVKKVALELGLPVCQPARGQCEQSCHMLSELGSELCVVVAFGQKLPCGALSCSAGTCVNVHYSLLPKLRGAAPVQHAILQGLSETGVTVQYVVPGWDEGDIILQRALPIEERDTCGSLTERLTDVGVEALIEALTRLDAGTATRTIQDGSQASFAPLIKSEDARLDWALSAEVLARRVRAYNPWPGAYTQVGGKRLKVLAATDRISSGGEGGEAGEVVEMGADDGFGVRCGTGLLWVEEVQVAGKRPMAAQEYLRGARLEVGMRLG